MNMFSNDYKIQDKPNTTTTDERIDALTKQVEAQSKQVEALIKIVASNSTKVAQPVEAVESEIVVERLTREDYKVMSLPKFARIRLGQHPFKSEVVEMQPMTNGISVLDSKGRTYYVSKNKGGYPKLTRL